MAFRIILIFKFISGEMSTDNARILLPVIVQSKSLNGFSNSNISIPDKIKNLGENFA